MKLTTLGILMCLITGNLVLGNAEEPVNRKTGQLVTPWSAVWRSAEMVDIDASTVTYPEINISSGTHKPERSVNYISTIPDVSVGTSSTPSPNNTEQGTSVLSSSEVVMGEERTVIISSVTSVTDTQRIRISFPLITSFNLEVSTSSVWNRLSIGAGIGVGAWGYYVSSSWLGAFPRWDWVKTVTVNADYRKDRWGLRIETTYAQGEMKTGERRESPTYSIYPLKFYYTSEVQSNSLSFSPKFFYWPDIFIGIGIEYYYVKLIYSIWEYPVNSREHIKFSKTAFGNGLDWQILFGWENKLFKTIPITWTITYKHFNSTIDKLYVNISGVFFSVGTKFGGNVKWGK